MRMRLFIGSDGTVRYVNDDQTNAVVQAISRSEARIKRASHVEPTNELSMRAQMAVAEQLGLSETEELPHNKWWADMSPSGGPVLGPFETRTEALAAEAVWIENKLRESSTWNSDRT